MGIIPRSITALIPRLSASHPVGAATAAPAKPPALFRIPSWKGVAPNPIMKID